jgi:hypothetical protein
MAEPKSKTEWDKTDTIQKWKKLNANEKKLYVANIKARLKKPPTQEVTTWLKQADLKEIKTAVMTPSKSPDGSANNSPSGSPRGGPDEAKAKLAFVLSKYGHNMDVDEFKDDDWKKDWHKLTGLHKDIHAMLEDPKSSAFIKAWLKDSSRKGLKILLFNCDPINYANLKGIVEADSPDSVGNYMTLNKRDEMWRTALRKVYEVDNLGSLIGGKKKSKVEEV